MTSHLRRFTSTAALAASIVLPLASDVSAQGPGSVLQTSKISSFLGAFPGQLDDQDQFGRAVTSLGDLNGDGIDDLAVGAEFDDDGASGAGAVWILFMTNIGTVGSAQKISATQGGFTGVLDSFDRFGASLAALGDLDGDGVTELAVGAPNDDDGGATSASNFGALWILRLKADGTVKSHQKISNVVGNLQTPTGNPEPLEAKNRFGSSVALIGDLNGDGKAEVAVGSEGDGDGGFASNNRGAVFILFLADDQTVDVTAKVSEKFGNFSAGVNDKLADNDLFGASVVAVGDLNLDQIPDIAVGMPGEDEGGSGRGGVYIIFLDSEGSARDSVLIAEGSGGFSSTLVNFDAFGTSVAAPGDLNGDAVPDLIVGAPGDDDVAGGGVNGGALWVLFLGLDGVVLAETKISDLSGGFVGAIESDDRLGTSLGVLAASTANGIPRIVTGAIGDDDGGASGSSSDRGAVWLLTLNGSIGTPIWTPIDGGISGTDDLYPRLGADGPLTFQSTTTVRLVDALPNSIVTLIISTVAINAPFKGGTLVPSPLITTGFVLGDDGALELSGEMPEDVPIGVPLYLQYFIGDAGAVEGFAATNAVQGLRQ